MEIKQLAQELSKRTLDVCKLLFPTGGNINGQEFEIGDVEGNPGDSLRVHLTGEKAGVWTDFADGQVKGGDLLELWRQRKKQNLSQTIEEVKKFLGITDEHGIKYKAKEYVRPSVKGSVLREESPVMRYLVEQRLLEPSTLKEYRIQEIKRQDKKAWIEFPYYRNGEVTFIKYLAVERIDGKKEFSATPNSEPSLFGWDQLPPHTREVTITEGEINAMTLHQLGYPALATPFGAGAGNKHAWIQEEYERLERFELIYILGDNDGPGRKMTEDLVMRLGRHRCKILTLPFDPNDCLRNGVDLASFYAEASYLEPVELKRPNDFKEEVKDHFHPILREEPGFAPLFKPLFVDNRFQLHFRPGEYTVWTGYNFEGKSQMIKQMQIHALLQHQRVLVIDFENPPEVTMARLARALLGYGNPTDDMIEYALDWLSEDRLWLLDWEDEAPLEQVLDSCTYAAKRFGISQIFIDSLMCLSDVPEDDIDAQRKAVNKIVQFGKRYDAHTHLVAHFRKPPPTEVVRTRVPDRFSISGTSKISDRAFNVIIVSRNRLKEAVLNGDADPEEGKSRDAYLSDPDALFIVDKQRNGTNWIGRVKLWWDQDAMQYLDSMGQRPVNYIERYNKRNGSN